MGTIKRFNKKLKEEFINDKLWFFAIWAYVIFATTTFELFNRPFGNVHNLKIAFDDIIPFIKELIIVYHSYMYVLVIVGLLLLVNNKKEYKKYILSLFISQSIAYIIFMNFQTFVPRYDTSLLGNDIFSKLVKTTYEIDNSYSGLPSMHVCNTFLASFYYFKSSYSNKNKFFLITYLIIIASTTVLVKQHVFLDIPAGIIHAILNYYLIELIFVIKNKLKK